MKMRMHENVTGAVSTIIGGTILASILDWFGLNGVAVLVYAILLFLDFGFGVLDAYMLSRDRVTSNTAYRGMLRKTVRLSLPFIIVLILKGAGLEDTKIIIDSIISILILTEGYSILGHIVSIDHGKQLPEIDAFEMLCKSIAKFLEKGIKDKIPEEEEGE